jgi:thioredoxin reductase
MAKKSIIIIGAGAAGLCAGIYGLMNRYETRICETPGNPGGVSTGREVIWRQCRIDKKQFVTNTVK